MREMETSGFVGKGPEKTYQEFLSAGIFQIQQCIECKKYLFYPRAVCPYCSAAAFIWLAPSGRGTVYSTTIVRRKPENGGDYNVAIVELAEGPRLMTRIESIAPEHVRIGMEVTAYIAGSGDNALLVFVPEIERSGD